MNRLTKSELVNGIPVCYPNNGSGLGEYVNKANPYRNIVEKLKEYEDLEEQDKLLKLSYAVGDTVYVFLPNDNHFTKAQINKIEVKPTIYGKMCYFIEPVGNRGHLYRYFESDFGKAVFLNKESALQKMNEMEGKE